ncbi:hypothetical protein [Fusibacter ferrireducens]|uniref:Uncharacterized protein n=1 Tax=Fusibacter ferrireducens TaxID=2785058 RepID=A0ABR9ZTQ1_9FIRM|nr:hypothetical protein [Fusibacter ferrireducens]MBF4693864.1 hypothetical protein [Fusibacter ferrireducens]
MRKIYLLFLMLIGLLYWIVALDHANATGKPIAVLMILIWLLIEILVIKHLRKEAFDSDLLSHFLIDLINGIEWLIFFGFAIKLFSSGMRFFEAQIEMRTFLFMLTISLLVMPAIAHSKRKKHTLNHRIVLFALLGFFLVDWIIVYLELHYFLLPIYTSNSIRFATSSLSVLMYITWILNVEFVKKQFLF